MDQKVSVKMFFATDSLLANHTKARVAVARKLTEILYQLWKQSCDYHGYLLRGLRTVGEPAIWTGR
jgi:hypothetical protein